MENVLSFVSQKSPKLARAVREDAGDRTYGKTMMVFIIWRWFLEYLDLCFRYQRDIFELQWALHRSSAQLQTARAIDEFLELITGSDETEE